MGLVKLPEIRLYWSTKPIYAQSFPRKIMSRDRFEILLKMLHFSNNELEVKSDRLSKVSYIIKALNQNFQKYYDPPETVCIVESLIPFRGRIVFRQYLKNKRHKYGTKIFKLCFGYGYTYNCSFYAGKIHEKEKTAPVNVVMKLSEKLLDKGHTICTDNWYTLRTLRSNRKDNPKEIESRRIYCKRKLKRNYSN